MEISATLDRIRTGHPGCQMLAFADLTTKMVLCTSAHTLPGQEYLDALCTNAADMLEGEVAAQMAPVITSDQAPHIQYAVTLQPEEVVIYVRSRHCPGEALFGLCDASADIESILAELTVEVDRLTEEPS